MMVGTDKEMVKIMTKCFQGMRTTFTGVEIQTASKKKTRMEKVAGTHYKLNT